ncbi:MAG: DUF523 domain-containing protein [Smithella sp.]
MKPIFTVSACLLGQRCRWDGQFLPREKQLKSLPGMIPICPEQLGGLEIPREPAQIIGGNGYDVLNDQARVITSSGVDVTGQFIKGAREALKIVRLSKVKIVVLKERSPSCGVHYIYHGKNLVPGMGVTCALLMSEGFEVLSSEEIDKPQCMI